MNHLRLLHLIAPLLLAFGNLCAKNAPAEPVSYYQDIRPIFQAHCIGCHQPSMSTHLLPEL